MDAVHDTGVDLTDRIYEAAFVPELWPDVLRRLSEITDSAAGSFIIFDDELKSPRYIATDIIKPVMDAIDAAGEWQRSEVVRLMFSLTPPGAFFYDADIFPPDALEANDMRYRRARPLGIGGEVGTFVGMPTGELMVFTVERWLHNDRPTARDLERLNRQRPHLARAGLMAARLGLERAQATASALEVMGLPAAVLTRRGSVRATNGLLDVMQSVFLPTAFGGMAITDAAANHLFRQAVEAAGNMAEPVVRSIPVRARGEDAPMIVHVLPLRRSAYDIFAGADVIVAVTKVSATNLVPSPSVLTGLFDLAPSEARLAVALTQGSSLKAFATAAGITFGTARKYLDRIYIKTGTHQQSQLVALLKGAQPINMSEPRRDTGH